LQKFANVQAKIWERIVVAENPQTPLPTIPVSASVAANKKI
jgi:hypothetical protein